MCLSDALSTSDKTVCDAARTMQTLFSSQRELLPSLLRPSACLRVMKSKKRDSAGRLSMPRRPRPRTEPTTTLLLSSFLFNSLSFLVDLAKERKWRGRRARKLFTSRSQARRGGATFVAVLEADNAHVFSHPTQLCLARATEGGE